MTQPYANHRLHRSQPHRTTLLLVTSHVEHVQALRALALGRTQRLHIEWARDDRLAIDLALQLQPQLVLIDARLNGDRAPALRRYLSRGIESVVCYTCHERGQPVLGASHADTLHWDEVPMLLRHWAPPVPHNRPETPSGGASE